MGRHATPVSAAFLLTSLVVVATPGTHMVAAITGLAAALRRHVLARPRVVQWMRRTFAAAFVALGAKLALTSR
jgi:threonine/homoserine/homoserine lactone efflux protein